MMLANWLNVNVIQTVAEDLTAKCAIPVVLGKLDGMSASDHGATQVHPFH
jgi:hypothetical protein